MGRYAPSPDRTALETSTFSPTPVRCLRQKAIAAVPHTLTFTIEPSVDRILDDRLRHALEAGLRQQLSGLVINPAAAPTNFDVQLDEGSSARVCLTDASEMAPLTNTTRIVIVDPYEPRGTPVMKVPNARSEQLPQHSSFERSLEIPGDLGEYVGLATVWSSGPDGADPAVAARFDRLVGIPKHEVLADTVGRLQPEGLIDAWSREHYGRVIPAVAEAAGSAPCILLAGDPGTGKSALAHGLAALAAAELQEDVAFVQLNQRLRGYGIQGRAGTDVVNFLAGLTRLAVGLHLPIIVFLDEAEAVGGHRSARDDGSGALENTAVVDALIIGLDRVRTHSGARLVFLMATNLVERVDPAVLRRATVYRFERPSAPERAILLSHALTDAVDVDTLSALNEALDRADGLPLTAADVVHQVVARGVREAATNGRPLDPTRLLELARTAVATSSVARP